MFSFVAFSVSTGKTLSHNENAWKALQDADQLAPTQGIRVIHAGELGAAIWAKRMSLDRACAVVAKARIRQRRKQRQVGSLL